LVSTKFKFEKGKMAREVFRNVKKLRTIITLKIYHQTFVMRPNFEQFSIRFSSRQSIKKEQESYLVLDFDTQCEISLLC